MGVLHLPLPAALELGDVVSYQMAAVEHWTLCLTLSPKFTNEQQP